MPLNDPKLDSKMRHSQQLSVLGLNLSGIADIAIDCLTNLLA